MKNKKGLSEIVTTLIIVVLVFVAIGIVWGVVKVFLDIGAGTIEISSKCQLISLTIKGNTSSCEGTGCSVSIERDAGGVAFDGVKILVSNATGSGNAEVSGNIADFETVVKPATGVGNANKIAVVPYFLDDSNVKQLCLNTVEYKLR